MKRRSVWIVIALVALFIFHGSPEAGADQKSPWEKVNLKIGGLYNKYDSTLRVGANDINIDIDVEKVLGLDESATNLRLEAHWRFSENLRHRVDFDWFPIHRSGKNTLGENIVIGDTEFPIGATVKSSLDVDIFKVAYSYSFLMTDRVDLSASLGLYVAPIKYEISGGDIWIGEESGSITAPLPAVGLGADYAITPTIFLRTELSAFYVEIKRYTGALTEIGAALEWRPFKHLGFGVQYSSFS